jgi:tRNA dimethylallyltransferase
MKRLLGVVGPTGTGKSCLALKLAKKFDGEIVSADSRQIYVGMDMGTGKEIQKSGYNISEKGKGKWVVDGIPIYLYDIISPEKTFSVAQYQQEAYKVVEQIHKRNKLPVLVGGTGLYVRAVVIGLKIPKVAPNYNLRKHLGSKPLSTLFSELEKVDPKTAAGIDRLNPRRIVRALEVFHQTGQPISRLKGKYKVDFDCLLVGLSSARDYLYRRVNDQVEKWFQQGFVDEVKTLLKKGYKEDLTSMTALGYRQVVMYLRNKISLEDAKQRIKWEQHAYIRRQLTWFRKEPNIHWFDISDNGFEKEVFKLTENWLGLK